MALKDSLLHNDTEYHNMSDDADSTSRSSSSSSLSSALSSLSPSSVYAKAKENQRVLIVALAALSLVVVLVVAYLVIRASEPAEPTPPLYEPWKSVLLPGDVRPSAYDLDLTIDPVNLFFSGIVTITLQSNHSSPYVVLHAKNLTIDSVRVVDPRGALLNSSFFLFPDHDYLVVSPSSPVTSNGSSVLTVTFHSPLTKSLAGLYYSTYSSPTRGSINIATTQFEPTDARRAFPCFDEPAMKATFTLHINAPVTSPTTLSNMDVVSVQPYQAGWYRTNFRITPPHVHLPRRLRGVRLPADQHHHLPRRHRPHLGRTREGLRHRQRHVHRRRPDRRIRAHLQRAVPATQAGHDRHSRLRCGSHGSDRPSAPHGR